MTALYWLASAAFFILGAVALARPEAILGIRARLRPPQKADLPEGRRRKTFGPREVRICGVALWVIATALARSLALG